MKAVVHLTGEGEADRDFAIRCASALRRNEELALDEITLLAHRDGVRLVTPDAPERSRVAELIETGVSVKAGSTCLDARNLPRDVLPGVELVPSGVSELVRLQSEGYEYVKIP
ncbi:hypothetical protein AUR64_07375 [Haloprofundus marisrubri]|uniref:Uncharacterized protein n=1 Tax=Haloprofundus marisrubri TaxID=1514971 RepID=A0A0W1RC86_9EURY|nr:DsrE family protein [Haloprofundus marisrubri]KTG10982.1 hypothetical protein AUR64_07375 [Haloprofundus marisrubri]